MKQVPYQLIIEQTWNGEVASPAESVVVSYDDSDTHSIAIHIDAPFYNDPPPHAPPGSTWALWEHEVVELFLVASDGSYLELEFGPYGHYLALWLTAPREINTSHIPISYEAKIENTRWHGVAQVPRHLVPEPVVRWNAFSISGSGSNRRYLAWSTLPGETPNFHQPQAFAAFPE